MINGVMAEALFWICLVDAILLINHEIDSAFWQEWKLFELPRRIQIPNNPGDPRVCICRFWNSGCFDNISVDCLKNNHIIVSSHQEDGHGLKEF
jgi:hypothetical protein